jgi:hypothetical protein
MLRPGWGFQFDQGRMRERATLRSDFNPVENLYLHIARNNSNQFLGAGPLTSDLETEAESGGRSSGGLAVLGFRLVKMVASTADNAPTANGHKSGWSETRPLYSKESSLLNEWDRAR